MVNSQIDSEPASKHRWADVGMLSVAAIWGLNMPIMKFALGRVDPYLFNATRLLISAITLGVIVYFQNVPILDRSPTAKPIRIQLLSVGVFAVLTGFAYQLLFLVGMDRTTAGNTALIMCAIPMWTALLARVLIKEQIRSLAWIGLGIAFVGTLVVTLAVRPISGGGSPVVGNLIVAAAAFCWSLGTVWSRRLMNQIQPLSLAFWGVTMAVPLHFLVVGDGYSELGKFLTDPWLTASLLYSGILSTGVAYFLWNLGIQILGTAHASIYQNLVPIVALLAAWILIKEIPVWLQLFGGTLIIVGVLVMRKNRD